MSVRRLSGKQSEVLGFKVSAIKKEAVDQRRTHKQIDESLDLCALNANSLSFPLKQNQIQLKEREKKL